MTELERIDKRRRDVIVGIEHIDRARKVLTDELAELDIAAIVLARLGAGGKPAPAEPSETIVKLGASWEGAIVVEPSSEAFNHSPHAGQVAEADGAKAPAEPRAPGSTPRPDGIPTNYEMVRDILLEKPGLTAREVTDAIEQRWWPGLKFAFLGPEFYRFVNKGRLERDDAGKLTVTEKGRGSVQPGAPNKPPAPPKVDPPPEPPKAPGAPPVGLPSVFSMVNTILVETGPRTVAGLVVAICDRWWHGMTSERLWPQLEKLIAEERFHRTADGKIHLPIERPPAPLIKTKELGPAAQAFAERRAAKAKAPRVSAPGIKLGPPAQNNSSSEFEWKGRSVALHVREFRLLQRLRPVIGKGFLGFKDLASAAFAGERASSDPSGWLRDMEPIINGKIERLGLKLELIPKMGYALKELS